MTMSRPRRSFAALIAVGVLLVAGCSSGGGNKAAPPTSLAAKSPVGSTTSPPAGSRVASTSPPQRCRTDTRSYTYAQLTALQPAIESIVKGKVSSVGTGEHAVEVNLFPGREALAASLAARFGNAVAITVGLAPYHCGDGKSRRCPPLQGSSNLPPGLHLALRLGTSSMRAATTSMNATLVVRDDSPKSLTMDTGQPLVADIVIPGTRTVVGTYGGGIGGTGFGFTLHDGKQVKITTVVAAWRCDGHPGSTLSPGRYGVRVGISRNERTAEYLAPEVPLTITR